MLRAIRGLGGAQGVQLGPIVCAAPVMRQCLDRVIKAARSQMPVLISGESGVGKELIAEQIHALSPGRSGRFVPLNCGALPSELAESELFGHIKGAFTGASMAQPGAFRAAQRGTIMLDELGELPLRLQPKLLRTLESGLIRPVGAHGEIAVDVRVVAATHRDLHTMVAAGDFRADLLYRLDVLRIRIPALRERPQDLDVLIPRMLEKLAPETQITGAAVDKLRLYAWPGNVRELRNVLARAILAADANRIQAGDIHLTERPASAPAPHSLRQSTFDAASAMLCANGGHRRRTYESLGVSKTTFYRWLRQGLITAPRVQG